MSSRAQLVVVLGIFIVVCAVAYCANMSTHAKADSGSIGATDEQAGHRKVMAQKGIRSLRREQKPKTESADALAKATRQPDGKLPTLSDKDIAVAMRGLRNGRFGHLERALRRKLRPAQRAVALEAARGFAKIKLDMVSQLSTEAHRLIAQYVNGNAFKWKRTRDELAPAAPSGRRASWASDGYIETVQDGRIIGVMTTRRTAPYFWLLRDLYRDLDRKLFTVVRDIVRD